MSPNPNPCRLPHPPGWRCTRGAHAATEPCAGRATYAAEVADELGLPIGVATSWGTTMLRSTVTSSTTTGLYTALMRAPEARQMNCTREQIYQARVNPLVEDPLDRLYDGASLRDLLLADEARRREKITGRPPQLSRLQRAAISAHWSAELGARVAATAERERCQVVVDQDID